ncbi:MAG: tetratricopeptide repeat protein [Candidatus Sedimenticola sp. (ex Thyasira tokunagai)]
MSRSFKSGIDILEVSPHFAAVKQHFLAGEFHAACRELYGCDKPATPIDWLLLIDLARAVGANRRSAALVRLANRYFPRDRNLNDNLLRTLLSQGRGWSAYQRLQLNRVSPDSKWEYAHWLLQCANALAVDSAMGPARQYLDDAISMEIDGSADSLFLQVLAQHALRDWDAAVELLKQALGIAPHWARAHTFLIDSLLSLGRVEEARNALQRAQQQSHSSPGLDGTTAMLAFSLGRFEEAEGLIEQYLHRWPHADSGFGMRKLLLILLIERGDLKRAREIAETDERLRDLFDLPDRLTQQRQFLHLPLFVQNSNECVPTSVSMIAGLFGHRMEPSQLYAEMRGREGVALWRMRAWLREHDFQVASCALDSTSVYALLDAGIPVIATSESIFTSHVEVICGYRRDLGIFYVRDPMNWIPLVVPESDVVERYQSQGGVIAIAPGDRTDLHAVMASHKSIPGNAMLDLAEAVDTGDTEAARANYLLIDDELPSAHVRNSYARLTVITPDEYEQGMRSIAANPQANVIARYQALLSVPNRVAREIVDRDTSHVFDTLSPFARRYLKLIDHLVQGNWQPAMQLVDQMINSGSGLPNLWLIKSDIHAELGDKEACLLALERALDLEPSRPETHQKRLQRRSSELSYKQYLDEFEAILNNPNNERKRLLWAYCGLLADGPAGLEYERAMNEHMRWHPYDPTAWNSLIGWYNLQGREDLAAAMRGRAAKLMPSVFSVEESTGDAAVKSDELPNDASLLLNIAKNNEDPRSVAARAALLDPRQYADLGWYEQGQLIVLQLLDIDFSVDGARSRGDALLPQTCPGYSVWFVTSVVETLTRRWIAPPLARIVRSWLEQQVPNFSAFADLEFERALLIESEGDIESALDALEAMLGHHPAHSGAHFRLGRLKEGQESYDSAVRHFQRSLEINPGLLGSMEGLVRVQQTLGREEDEYRALLLLRKKLPYDPEYLRAELRALIERGEGDRAHEVLEGESDRFSGAWLDLIAARLETWLENHAVAMELFRRVRVPDEEKLFTEWINVGLPLAQAFEDDDELGRLLDIGLNRWPESVGLVELRADLTAKTDTASALAQLHEALKKGIVDADIARLVIRLEAQDPLVSIQSIIEQVPESEQAYVAENMLDILCDAELVPLQLSYTRWAQERFPASIPLASSLANLYDLERNMAKAIEMASIVNELEPNNVANLTLLGKVWADRDAKQAVVYLQNALKLDRNADTLAELARAHQVGGNPAEAKSAYREALQLNPLNTHAWVNLFILGEDNNWLWSFVELMLVRGYGEAEEYFLAAVLRLAKKVGQTVPANWVTLAHARLAMLKIRPAFKDEQMVLRTGILAWDLKHRGALNRENAGFREDGRVSLWITSRLSAYVWPRSQWVPDQV